MRLSKRWGLLLVIVILSSPICAQNPTESTYEDRLFYLCKVWGHVKYYHSNVAAGNVDWDKELINIIPNVKNASSDAEFNESLLDLLAAAGETQSSNNYLPSIPDSLNNNLDLDWMTHDILSADVQSELANIQSLFRPRSNTYVSPSGINHPNFDTDDFLYENARQLTEPERLLGLFRYWNIIHYFFPYKHIMDQDWDTTLQEFVLAVAETSDRTAYHLVFKELTTRINDTHGFFSSPTYYDWEGWVHAPFILRYIENKTVITRVLNNNLGLQIGDIVKAIDGQPIEEVRAKFRTYAEGSNDIVIERNINNMIAFGPIGDFEITVENATMTKTLTLDRQSHYGASLYTNSNPPWKIVETDEGCRKAVVDMGKLESEQVAQMFEQLKDMDAIVFDIRNYPNGTLWEIVNYIYSGSITVARFTNPDVQYPGRLTWVDGTIGYGTANPYQGELIILFDERTQSQAEYTCMGLEQFPGAIKIGSTTAAADGNIAYIYLPDDILVGATFLGTYYPDYTPTQRVGIIPDIEIHPTIEGIRAGRDELLEVALQCNLSTDIETIGDANTFSVYPNPTSTFLQYDWTIDATQGKNFVIELVDVLGRIAYRTLANTPNGTLDVAALPRGTYLMKVNTESGIYTKKVVLQ